MSKMNLHIQIKKTSANTALQKLKDLGVECGNPTENADSPNHDEIAVQVSTAAFHYVLMKDQVKLGAVRLQRGAIVLGHDNYIAPQDIDFHPDNFETAFTQLTDLKQLGIAFVSPVGPAHSP